MNQEQIALQLYTVREHASKDMLGTLRTLADMGYTAVEFAGYGGVPVSDIRATLDECGIKAMGAHVQLAQWESNPEQAIKDLRTLGCDYATVPMVGEERRESAEAVRRLGEDFNRWGETCRVEGLKFGYHNHWFEFDSIGGETMLSLLMRETDPRLVGLELDVFWARYAGADPVGLIRDLSERISLVHVKDMASEEDKSDRPVGEGVLPWTDILGASDAAGAKWYIVEQDNPQDEIEDVRSSLRNLKQMAG